MHIFDFFRDIFSVFGAFSRFLGVKFGFRKSCQCKRNDKYEVWKGGGWRRSIHQQENEVAILKSLLEDRKSSH